MHIRWSMFPLFFRLAYNARVTFAHFVGCMYYTAPLQSDRETEYFYISYILHIRSEVLLLLYLMLHFLSINSLVIKINETRHILKSEPILGRPTSP